MKGHKDMHSTCMQCLYRGTLQKQLRTYWQEGLSLLDIMRINEGDAVSSSKVVILQSPVDQQRCPPIGLLNEEKDSPKSRYVVPITYLL